MLTSLLVLIASVCAVQDAEPARAAGQDAPDAAAAAPAETTEKVRSFLADAEKQFYDPQAAGLKSVEFDTSLVIAQLGGEVGKVHISWTAGSEPVASFTRAEGLELPPQVPAEMLAAGGEQVGRQLLDAMLNRPVSAMTRDAVATMGSAEDGLVKVMLVSDKAAQQGVKEHAIFFDDDGVLRKSQMVIDGAATGMPIGSVQIATTYNWKPATEGSELMIADGTVEEADLGMFGKPTSKTSFVSQAVDDMVIITSMTRSTEAPGGQGGETQTIEALNLVVNGKPVPSRAAPAPAGG